MEYFFIFILKNLIKILKFKNSLGLKIKKLNLWEMFDLKKKVRVHSREKLIIWGYFLINSSLFFLKFYFN